jgi:predicted RND superfamily exporter protein
MLNFSAVVLAAVAVIAVVVHLYYVHCVFQRTLVPVVTDVSATVVVNAAIVVHANVACR